MTSPIFCLLPFEYSLNLRDRVDVEARDQLGLVGRVDAAAQVREVLDRLAAGELVVEDELARQVAEAAMDRDRVDGRLDAEDRRPAARRPDVVEERPDRRRLAGAVRAEEAEGLAFVDLEVDVDDAAMRAVGLGQLLGLDDRGHAVTSFRLPMRPTAASVWVSRLQFVQAGEDRRPLALEEAVEVADVAQPGLRLRRPVGDEGEPGLGHLAGLAQPDDGDLHQPMQRVGRDAEVLAPIAGPGAATDEADLLEEPGHPAHRAAAGVQPLGDLRRRLLGGSQMAR